METIMPRIVWRQGLGGRPAKIALTTAMVLGMVLWAEALRYGLGSINGLGNFKFLGIGPMEPSNLVYSIAVISLSCLSILGTLAYLGWIWFHGFLRFVEVTKDGLVNQYDGTLDLKKLLPWSSFRSVSVETDLSGLAVYVELVSPGARNNRHPLYRTRRRLLVVIPYGQTTDDILDGVRAGYEDWKQRGGEHG